MNRAATPLDSADVMTLHHFDPLPIETMVLPGFDGESTVILRIWNPGDTARCRLCPAGLCGARENFCLLGVRHILTEEEASIYSTVGMPAQDPNLAPGERDGRVERGLVKLAIVEF